MMGKCRVEIGVTMNLGNFESFKVTVGFDEETKDDTPEAEALAFANVEKKVQARLDEIILTQGEHIMAFLPAVKEELGVRQRSR